MTSAKYSDPRFFTTDHSNQINDEAQIITARNAGEAILDLNGRKIMGAPETGLESENTNLASVGWVKGQIAELTSITATLREVVLTSQQLDDTEGILPAFGLYFTGQPTLSSSFSVLSDDLTQETFTEGVEWSLGANTSSSMSNLAAAINAGTSFKAKYCAGLSQLATFGAIIVYPKNQGDADDKIRCYASASSNTSVLSFFASTASGVVGDKVSSDYGAGKLAGDFVAPTSDQGARFSGFLRAKENLAEPETHASLNENEWRMWDAGTETWQVASATTGVATNGLPAGGATGEIPYKTSATDYDAIWSDVRVTESGQSLDVPGAINSAGGLKLPELSENGGNFTTLKGADNQTANHVIKLPGTAALVNQQMQVDPSDNQKLIWVNPPSSPDLTDYLQKSDNLNSLTNKPTAVSNLGINATIAEINKLQGLSATTAQLNFVTGVTSGIQSQLNAKAPLASPTFTGAVTLEQDPVNPLEAATLQFVLANKGGITYPPSSFFEVTRFGTNTSNTQSYNFADEVFIEYGKIYRFQMTCINVAGRINMWYGGTNSGRGTSQRIVANLFTMSTSNTTSNDSSNYALTVSDADGQYEGKIELVRRKDDGSYHDLVITWKSYENQVIGSFKVRINKTHTPKIDGITVGPGTNREVVLRVWESTSEVPKHIRFGYPAIE